MLKGLAGQKLVDKKRKTYTLTPKGQKMAEDLPAVHYKSGP
jgi:Mn-dependent DtxR family transcriptional regulator